MKFKYKAISPSGETISDVIEAKDKFDLAHQLKEGGKLLVFAEEEKGGGFINMASINAILSRVNTQEKITFARNLSAMVHAGLTLSRGMNILERQTKNERSPFSNACRFCILRIDKRTFLKNQNDDEKCTSWK